MALQDTITQIWVKITGKRIDPEEYAWLLGPIGDTDLIGDKYLSKLANEEGLEIRRNEEHFALIEDMANIGIGQESSINPKIRHFYENTADYKLDVKFEWKGVFKAFGWLLKWLFSRRLQQLNIPLKKPKAGQGMKSEIFKLIDPKTGRTKWTVWYRTISTTKEVIYSGIYTHSQVPGFEKPLFKIIFPLPNGNASIFMQSEIGENGSLILNSNGRKIGQPGFYFTLTNHKGKYWARFVRSMHEKLVVFIDEEEKLRADHIFKFWGITFLKLDYSMVLKS